MLATTESLGPSACLHEGFAKQVQAQPQASAVICADHVWTYAALGAKATELSHRLLALALSSKCVVAVVMEKGWEQIAAVLGVLGAGAAYVAFDPTWEDARARRLLDELPVAAVLTQARFAARLGSWPCPVLVVERTPRDNLQSSPSVFPGPATRVRRDDPACWELAPPAHEGDDVTSARLRVLSHRFGAQMFDELARRCGLDNEDRAFALGALESRAALPDLFGVLRAGGTLIVPHASEAHDVRQWWELMEDYEATVLSTTPETLGALLDHALARGASWVSGRLVLLVADWIPVHLPGRLRRFASGAKLVVVREDPVAVSRTASLVIEEVDPGWVRAASWAVSARPFVVLDETLRPCPPEVPGHLYLREAETSPAFRLSPFSRARFLALPGSGERVYRTGHIGRARVSGEIEFAAPNEFHRALRPQSGPPPSASGRGSAVPIGALRVSG